MKKIFTLLLGALSICSYSQTTQTFNYTGSLQQFTVPACVGTVTIQVKGAQGGYSDYSSGNSGGLGADITGTFSVIPGQVFNILVGGMGEGLTSGSGGYRLSAGGGGGSFVWDVANTTNPLIVAGGGGGSNSCSVTAGAPGSNTLGGTGLGGTTQCGGGCDNSLGVGGGGAGWNGNGTPCQTCPAAQSPLNGGAGGVACIPISPYFGGNGGYGGGGQGDGNCGGGGGGGGYTGGNGGGNTILCSSSGSTGGTSYNAGTSQINLAGVNSGNGVVIITYTVGAGPTVTASATNSTICIGQSTTISASGANTYSWQPGNLTGSSQTVSPTSTTTYTVIGTDVNNCTNTTTVTINVNALPTVTASATNSTICAGQSTTISASGANTYSWQPGNLTGSSQTVSPTSTTTYTVTGTDGNNCSNTSTVTVTVNALPSVALSLNPSTVCINWASYALTGGSPNGGTYSGTGVSGGNFDPSVAGVGTHVITYVYTDQNGCTDSTQQNITVDLCTGISELGKTLEFIVYPNPSQGSVTVVSSADALLTINNVFGEMVLNQRITSSTTLIDLTKLASGVYFLQMSNATNSFTQKLILNK